MLLAASMTSLHMLLAVVMLTVYVVGYYGSDKTVLLFLLYFSERSSLLELSLKGKFVTC